jgi:hypothetical protein
MNIRPANDVSSIYNDGSGGDDRSPWDVGYEKGYEEASREAEAVIAKLQKCIGEMEVCSDMKEVDQVLRSYGPPGWPRKEATG